MNGRPGTKSYSLAITFYAGCFSRITAGEYLDIAVDREMLRLPLRESDSCGGYKLQFNKSGTIGKIRVTISDSDWRFVSKYVGDFELKCVSTKGSELGYDYYIDLDNHK